MFDDPNKALQQLQERLLAMEDEPEQPTDPEAEDDIFDLDEELLPETEARQKPAVTSEEARRKRIGLLIILLLLELAVIFAAIGWWLTWK